MPVSASHFPRRTFFVLAVALLAGNLASLPILDAQAIPSGTVTMWLLYTTISLPVIAAGIWMAQRSGLGFPILDAPDAHAVLRQVPGLLLHAGFWAALWSGVLLLLNITGTPPVPFAWWKTLLASFDAGIQEEITYRLFVMSLLAWLGFSLAGRKEKSRPAVMWGAIVMSAALFAVAHVDAPAGRAAAAPAAALMDRAVAVGVLGMILGWLYWRHGLATAIVTHVAVDALWLSLVQPFAMRAGLAGRVLILVLLLAVAALCLVLLRRRRFPPNG